MYWQHAKNYKFLLIASVLAILFGDIFKILTPYLFKNFFDELTSSGDVHVLKFTLLLIVASTLAHWLFISIARVFNARFQIRVMRDIANTSFAFIHRHSFSFFNNNFVGSLVKKVNRFIYSFEGIADRVVWDFFPIALQLVMVVGVLSTRSIWIGAAILVWTIVFMAINVGFSQYKIKYDIQRSKLQTKTTGILADSITNHSNVKLLTGYEREKKRFANVFESLTKLQIFTWDLGTLFETIQWFLMIVLEMSIVYLSITLWQQGILTIGDFVLIQLYLTSLFDKLYGFGRIIRFLYQNLADAEEMTEIFEKPLEITEHRRAKELVADKGSIEFDKVNFSYHKTRRIMHAFNLTIKAGERVALVGPSGAGKSTIVKLLLRQHDVSRGQIRIDGQRIDRTTLESLWSAISLVPQDPILFHRTIMENIRYGKPDATDAEVIEAAKAANCHHFIDSFPEGYNTYVGERGVKLSGGERQRVAIARAILRNAPILILDEATASLDSESESLIQNALDTLMKGKTVIVVAHRLSTIMQSDRILVIDQGEIIEQGTHKKLLEKKDGQYKKLWELQAGGFLA